MSEKGKNCFWFTAAISGKGKRNSCSFEARYVNDKYFAYGYGRFHFNS